MQSKFQQLLRPSLTSCIQMISSCYVGLIGLTISLSRDASINIANGQVKKPTWKSLISYFPKILWGEIKDISGFKEMGVSSIYLGNSLIMSRNRIREFSGLTERVQKRLQGWSRHTFSKAGKATLIRSVVQAIPTYTMFAFQVPSGICKKMDNQVKKFWWGSFANSDRYLAMSKWKNLCKPKEIGRLGFRKFKDFNMALLSKLTWKMAQHEDKLWNRLFKAKYLRGQTFF